MATIFKNKETLDNRQVVKISLFIVLLPFLAYLDQSRPFTYLHGVNLFFFLLIMLFIYVMLLLGEKLLVKIEIDEGTNVLTFTIKERFYKPYKIRFQPESFSFEHKMLRGQKPMKRITLKDDKKTFQISRRLELTNREVNNILFVLENHYPDNNCQTD